MNDPANGCIRSNAVLPRLKTAFVLAAFAALAGTVHADARTLGGITSHKLTSYALSQQAGNPTVLRWEDFTGTNGTALVSTPLNNPPGGSWVAVAGTWTVNGSGRARLSSGTGNARVTTAAGTISAAVEAQLTVPASGSFNAGLVANDNQLTGADGRALAVNYSNAGNGRITIIKRIGTANTTLATVSNLGRIIPVTMRVDATTTTIRVYLNGTLVASYTLTATDASQLRTATNTGFGLWANNNTVTTFDNFHVDGP